MILVLIEEIWQKITVKWKLIIWVTWGTWGCCWESVRKLPIIVLSCHFSQQSHSHWLVFLYSWRNLPEMAKLLSYFQLSNCCSFCWHFIVTRRLEKNCKAKPWWKYFVMFDTCLYHKNYFNCLQLWHHEVNTNDSLQLRDMMRLMILLFNFLSEWYLYSVYVMIFNAMACWRLNSTVWQILRGLFCGTVKVGIIVLKLRGKIIESFSKSVYSFCDSFIAWKNWNSWILYTQLFYEKTVTVMKLVQQDQSNCLNFHKE